MDGRVREGPPDRVEERLVPAPGDGPVRVPANGAQRRRSTARSIARAPNVPATMTTAMATTNPLTPTLVMSRPSCGGGRPRGGPHGSSTGAAGAARGGPRDAVELDQRGDATATECQVDPRRCAVEDRRLEIVHLGPVLVDRRDVEPGRDAVAVDRHHGRRPVRLGQERDSSDQARRGPDDLRPLPVGGGESAVELGQEAAGEAELAGEGPIDPALVEAGDPAPPPARSRRSAGRG